MTTAQSTRTPSKTPLKKPAASKAKTAAPLSAPSLTPGDVVKVAADGDRGEFVGGLLAVSGTGRDQTMTVLLPIGKEIAVSARDCRPGKLQPHAPLQPNDVVFEFSDDERSYVVKKGGPLTGPVTLISGTGGKRREISTMASRLYVAARVNPDDLRRDVMRRATTPGETPVAPAIESSEPELPPVGTLVTIQLSDAPGDQLLGEPFPARVLRHLSLTEQVENGTVDAAIEISRLGIGGGTEVVRADEILAVLPEAETPVEISLGERFPIPVIEPAPTGIQRVPWNKILNSPLNPRKHFEQEALIKLAVSIYRLGLKQNIQARPHPDRPGFYEIAAGERRWRAIGLLVKGLEVGEGAEREMLVVQPDYPVAALIEAMTDLELLEQATSENVQRKDMTPLEEADAFAQMLDMGARVEDIAQRFDYSKKTVLRRVGISRRLIPELRALYDDGRLGLAHAEILCIAPESVQRDLLSNQLRYNIPTPQALKALISSRVFLTEHAQFPRSWYKGAVEAGDLFGDLPEHFADFAQALELQKKHAVHLADKDVAQGASFSDVRVGTDLAMWRYHENVGEGTLYFLNSVNGVLKRYEKVGLNTHYATNLPDYRARPPIPVHETTEIRPGSGSVNASTPPISGSAAPSKDRTASAPTPAPIMTPRYPLREWQKKAQDRTCGALLIDRTLLYATALYMFLIDQEEVALPASVHAAAQEAARLTEGHLAVSDEGVLSLGLSPQKVPYALPVALPALLALPEALLEQLYTAVNLIYVLDLASWDDLVEIDGVRAVFRLDEAFLAGCNRHALLEMAGEHGVPLTWSDEDLRAELLNRAPDLAEAGWRPQPFRGQA